MFSESLLKTVFGRLSFESFPIHEPILLITFIVVMLGGAGLVAAVTYFRLWGWLWREWFTSVDHKKIGIMYMILGIIMLLRGFADALMMRTQQAIAFGANQGYLPAHHYDQVFSAHGTIMIFFVAIPLVVGDALDPTSSADRADRPLKVRVRSSRLRPSEQGPCRDHR
jgi:cytochrome o ubiquinol oxidase subunit 1